MKKYFVFSLLLVSFTALGKGSCRDLDVGEALKVDIGSITSPTNVEHKYSLKRISDLQYESYVNLEFKAHKSLKDEEFSAVDFRKYVQSCYEKFNHRLVDEKGRSISLKLFDASEDRDIPSPAKVSIKVMPSDHRANSHAYNVDIDCEVVVHEGLHLMGLIDEYEEEEYKLNPNLFSRMFKRFVSKSKKGPAFDCRATGPVNSVMHNEWFLSSDIQVLFSAQLDTILYPNCKTKNQDYYSCSSKVYKTSRTNGALFGCGEIKDVCKTYNWVLSKDSPLRNSPTANAGLRSEERTEMKMHFLLNQ